MKPEHETCICGFCGRVCEIQASNNKAYKEGVRGVLEEIGCGRCRRDRLKIETKHPRKRTGKKRRDR